jgi:gas vesicle protein
MGEEASTSEKALYLLFGAIMGAAAALLLAPRSGEETRKLIASRARESADAISNRTKDVAGKTSDYVDRGKEVLQHQRDQISAAIEAGKQAYKEEKEKA